MQCCKWFRNTTTYIHFVLASYFCLFRMVYPQLVLAVAMALNQSPVIPFLFRVSAEADCLHFVLVP